MVAYGEENRDWGGAFACYRGLTESLPYHRLLTPQFPKPRLWVPPADMHSKAGVLLWS